MRNSRLFRRLRTDFQLSILTLMGALGVLGVSPYAIYRLLEGNYVVGVADTIIVGSTIVAVLYAWRSGDTVKPGIAVSIIFSAAATLITIKLGINGLFWIYPLILFNFFMVSPGKALLAMLLVLSTLIGYALCVPGAVFESHYQLVSFLVTCLMASFMSFVFAYRNHNQRDQLQLLSVLDPLTGARNRRAMNEALKNVGAVQRRQGDNYAVLVMDLDHFKQINDNHGHLAGDQVLIDFVELIKGCSRKEDSLFRFGGEEFLLLLPNTDLASLRTAAEHLQAQVAERLKSPGGVVTMSSGGALLQKGEHWEALLQRADQCLYQAKDAGRNRAIIDTPAQRPPQT
jgi:diguanylate cyclase (GGDEF)-like protein